MKSKRILFCFLVLLFIAGNIFPKILHGQNKKLKSKKVINIGVVCDAPDNEIYLFFKEIESETGKLLKSRYDIRFPEKYFRYADFTKQKIQEQLNDLLNNNDVDIIIGFGTITALLLDHEAPFEKPVIGIGIFDINFQSIELTEDFTTNRNNYTFLTLPIDINKSLQEFHIIYPYKKLGILIGEELFKIGKKSADEAIGIFNNSIKDLSADAEFIIIGDSPTETINNLPEDIDAIYIAPVYSSHDPRMSILIDAINRKKIPTFSINGESDVISGALAGVRFLNNQNKLARRMALTLEKIIEGENPSSLPVIVNYKYDNIFNVKTMYDIGYFPNWRILSSGAEMVNENYLPDADTLNLLGVIREALKANLNLEQARKQVTANAKEVNIAKSNILPNIDASASGIMIDQDRAEASLGQNPEISGTGQVALNQVIFSDEAFANIYIQKKLLESDKYALSAQEMDIIRDAACTYLNVLMAKTQSFISIENYKLTKENLEIAESRHQVGYSGMADVYRWQSELALAKSDQLKALNTQAIAEMALMELLNRPIDHQYYTEDVSIFDTTLNIENKNINSYTDDPLSYGIFRDFLTNEALTHSPEIKQVQAGIDVNERVIKTTHRAFYLPSFGLQANADYIFYRGGKGSDYKPVVIEIPGNDPIVFGSEPKDFQWNVGISATLPLFAGGKRNAKFKQAKINHAISQDQLYDVKNKIIQRLYTDLENVGISLPNVSLSKQAAEAADKSLILVQDGYSKGVVNITGLIDAQGAALRSQLFSANSVYQYYIDFISLQRSIGFYLFLISPEENVNFLHRADLYMFEHSKK